MSTMKILINLYVEMMQSTSLRGFSTDGEVVCKLM